MANSIGNAARELALSSSARRAKRKSARKNSNLRSGGGGRRVASSTSGGSSKKVTSSGAKPKFTKADLVAFNKLPDKVRKASKKKIAAFQAAGVGVFEDYSVHTSGKGFGKFFDKVSPKFKSGGGTK